MGRHHVLAGGLDAALPDDWEIVADHQGRVSISRRARTSSCARSKRIAPDAALIEVPYPEQSRRAALSRARSAAPST